MEESIGEILGLALSFVPRQQRAGLLMQKQGRGRQHTELPSSSSDEGVGSGVDIDQLWESMVSRGLR